MFQAKEMMEQRKAARAALSGQLDAQIAEQRAAITKMETELEASGQVTIYNIAVIRCDEASLSMN